MEEDPQGSIVPGLLKLYQSHHKKTVKEPFHIDQKREQTPEVRWTLSEARDHGLLCICCIAPK